MNIMITGGYDEAKSSVEKDTALLRFARALAAEAIRQHHQLRCGNMSSLDVIVIEEACDAAVTLGKNPDELVMSYHPKGEAPRTMAGSVSGSAISQWNSMDGRRPSVPEPIAQSDVLILVGGYSDASGTYTAANWARQTGTPILPVATFGMAAADIFDDLPDSVEQSKITGISSQDLQILTRSEGVLVSPESIQKYAEQVISLAEKAALSRDVFLIMSFEESDDLEDYKAAVTQVCKEAGFEAIRTDTRPAANAQQIIDLVQDQIQSCGFVIADLTNERPNVYYEIGFAKGLDKRLILTSKKDSTVHFDLHGYNRVDWTGSENLKKQLRPIVKEIAQSFGLIYS